MSNLDHQIFLWINSMAGRWAWLDVLGYFFAVCGVYILMAAAIYLGFYKIHRKRFYLAFVSSLVSSYLFVKILKIIVNRPRPYQVLPVHQLLSDTGSGQSFSSGHAVIMFSIAFSFYGTEYFWPFLAWAFICSFARVFVGVHYPGDVLASIAIAGLTVYIFHRVFKRPIKAK